MMTTPKPALPEPVGFVNRDELDQLAGEKSISLIVEAEASGWRKTPIYDCAAIDAAVAEARAEMQERTADQLRTIKALMVGMPDEGTTPVIRRIAWLEQQLAEARAVPEGWSISRQENGSIDIRGPGHIAVNVRGAEQSPRLIPTQVLYELAEAMLSAPPSPAEQPVAAHKTQSMSDNAACGSEVSDKEQPKPAVRTHGDGNAR